MQIITLYKNKNKFCFLFLRNTSIWYSLFSAAESSFCKDISKDKVPTITIANMQERKVVVKELLLPAT
jgi:hypothetical protein